MKHNLKTYFAASALLLAGAASLTGCTSDDDFGRYPEGSIPLSIGSVGVAGVETATRVATTENASGFTGIRKTTFVNGDALALTLSNDGGTTTTSVTATLTGGAWVLNPAKNFVIPGTTTIKAAYTPAATTGMKADLLEATTYTMDGQKVTFAMKHVHAMIDITYTAGVAPTSITVTAHNGTADENLSTVLEEEADGTKHFRSIASAGTVKSLTAVINGQNYVATLATPLTVEANKRYPIALTFKENLLTATVGTATLNWNTGGAGELLPSGYDRYISTPEDLAQFAKDVNGDIAGTGACTAKVLQMADIDLAQLKTAAAANTANPGKNYTYTATAENWVGIGSAGNFTGTYNGNGHTISNMKITSGGGGCAGLFFTAKDATLTGIHLRGVSISPTDDSSCGPLCVYVSGATKISLCSATGDISGQHSNDRIGTGGLISSVGDNAIITRCSSGVNITSRATSSGYMIGGFVGEVKGTPILAGCSYNGNLDCPIPGYVGGFIGRATAGNACIFGCSSSGTMTVEPTSAAWAFFELKDVANITITSCYSTMSGTNIDGFGPGRGTYTDCAWTGTSTDAIAGVTYNVAVADLYDKITASSASSPAAVKTLHWSAADGYTTTEVSDTWDASSLWRDNRSAAPTVEMGYEGGVWYKGQPANLLALPGKDAYWVAPVNTTTKVAWTAIDFTSVCPAGWHVPTEDEFSAMTGVPINDNFDSHNAAIQSAFRGAEYCWLAGEVGTDASQAWALYVDSDTDYATVYIHKCEKTVRFPVRCVRKK